MKVTTTIKKEIDVKYLHVEVEPRHWCDIALNGGDFFNDDDDMSKINIPCRYDDKWEIIIDLETGQITNWEKGTIAQTSFKVCDAGTYTLTDKDNIFVDKYDGYVPDMLCPDEEGYGDYIIMTIDENGFIKNFKADLTPFENDDD